MYCYYQNLHPRPGGIYFAIPIAVGVCHHCGVAVCKEHAHKDDYPGAPLLCHECAKLPLGNGHAILETNGIKQPEHS